MSAPTLFAAATPPFYDPFESLNEDARESIKRKHLQDIVELARSKSPYYKKRLEGLELDIGGEHPLKDFPVLTSQDLREQLPPVSGGLLTGHATAYTVFQSGGTTGVPKTSLFTHGEMELINACNARGFFAAGLEPGDRVANLWAVGGLYMTFIHMNRMLQQYGCTSFPFSNQTPADFVHTVAGLFKINCFTGITSVVLDHLREIDRKAPGSLKIDKIYFGGEHIYETDRREMAEKFGTRIIAAPGYGTVDSWYLGYQCGHCANGIFHAFDDMVYLEITDDSMRSHAATGETGMLLATVFHRKLTPVIRFRVGDKARWLGRQCPCGRTTPLFELLGRGDDVLRIGYDSVDYGFIQQLAARIAGASSRIQMEKRREDGRDRLVIRIETAAPPAEHAAMTARLTGLFVEQRPAFREFVKKGTVWPLCVEWLEEGKLPHNRRTGKLIRVVDAL
ncbi:MAG: hypothetical protein A2583_07710 [Bdellovibrionales bacterium RIFOXYD1_FULL_53_11]|nr:MAG: hypothetical protein A2583_07710 [Bdellovibrionales bacterium RIFOXYD1_FULL_53_11]